MSQAALTAIPKLQRAVLELILEQFERYNDQVSISENDLKMFSDYGYNAAVVRGCLSELEKSGYFVRESGGNKLSTFSFERWHLGPKGLEFWQEQRDTRQLGESKTTSPNESIEDIASIPASDRFVSRSDNLDTVTTAAQSLDKLVEVVRGDNESFTDDGQRQAIINEIGGIRSYLDNTYLRLATIWQWTKEQSILCWLFTTAMSKLVQEAALNAWHHLLSLL